MIWIYDKFYYLLTSVKQEFWTSTATRTTLLFCSRWCSILGKFAVTSFLSRYGHQRKATKFDWQWETGCALVCGRPSQNVLGWHRLASSMERLSATVALPTWMERSAVSVTCVFSNKMWIGSECSWFCPARLELVDSTVAFSPTCIPSVWWGWTKTAWSWFATVRASVCLAAPVTNISSTIMTLLDVVCDC